MLWSLDSTILQKEDRHEAAHTWVPVYVALMSGAFMSYLLLKGLKKIIHLESLHAYIAGILFAVSIYVFVKRLLIQHDSFFKNSKKSINKLFNLPLVFSAALLSFAHGANDVANAIGPFAAIYDTVSLGSVATGSAGIPVWIMCIGALGLAV